MKSKNTMLSFLLAASGAAVICFTLYAFLAAGGESRAGGASGAAEPETLNRHILDVIEEYPVDGSYGQLTGEGVHNTFGVTQDLYYGGRRVLRGDPQNRSYCIGLAMEVYLRACEEYARETWGSPQYRLARVEPDNFEAFRKDFYGVDGDKRTFVRALAERGLGKIVSLEEAKPGDLVQFWRNGSSGHAVIFLGLDRDDDDGDPEAIRYWSVQSSTDGIGRNSEPFGSVVIRHATNIVRPYVPSRP